MNDRIHRLISAAQAGDIYPKLLKVEYDEFDQNLSSPQRIAKRLTEYMEAQPCAFSDDNELVGLIRFDGSVEAALFPRTGHRFYRSVARFAEGRTDFFGNPLTFGNLTGYHPHFAWHGANTKATPDGRVAGSAFLFGGGQAGGKDRSGLTSLLLSVAHMDPTGVMCGNSIFNLSVDERIVTDDASFEKLVLLVETYFKEGGLHIQLNHVSVEELRAAQKNPDAYKSVRVRVSGFSAYFVGLKESIQDDVIARTDHLV